MSKEIISTQFALVLGLLEDNPDGLTGRQIQNIVGSKISEDLTSCLQRMVSLDYVSVKSRNLSFLNSVHTITKSGLRERSRFASYVGLTITEPKGKK